MVFLGFSVNAQSLPRRRNLSLKIPIWIRCSSSRLHRHQRKRRLTQSLRVLRNSVRSRRERNGILRLVLRAQASGKRGHQKRVGRSAVGNSRRRDLVGANLKGLNLALADLSGLSLYGAQCDGINLLGARLYRTDFRKASFRGAELVFSYAAGANFRGADLRECSLYRAEIGLSRRHSFADFTDALVNEASDIPEIKVFDERRL